MLLFLLQQLFSPNLSVHCFTWFCFAWFPRPPLSLSLLPAPYPSTVLLSYTRPPLPVISGLPYASLHCLFSLLPPAPTDLPRALFENIQSDKFGPAGSKACCHHYIILTGNKYLISYVLCLLIYIFYILFIIFSELFLMLGGRAPPVPAACVGPPPLLRPGGGPRVLRPLRGQPAPPHARRRLHLQSQPHQAQGSPHYFSGFRIRINLIRIRIRIQHFRLNT
jgi:hypothetical protein